MPKVGSYRIDISIVALFTVFYHPKSHERGARNL